MTDRKLLIVGAGALGRELAYWIGYEGGVDVLMFDDDLEKHGGNVVDKISAVIDYSDSYPKARALCAVADPALRRDLVTGRLAGLRFSAYWHQSVLPESTPSDHFSDGSIFLPYSLVSVGARVGRHVVMNTHSAIGHDCIVGDFCTISGHALLCGGVELGESVFIGAGATVAPDVRIGDGAYVGAGAVVLWNIPPGVKVAGNPARPIS